jgi:hypothetical protein
VEGKFNTITVRLDHRKVMSERLAFDIDQYVFDVCRAVRDFLNQVATGPIRLVLIKATTESYMPEKAWMDPYFLQYEVVIKRKSGEDIRVLEKQHMPRPESVFFPEAETARILLLRSIRSAMETAARSSEHDAIALRSVISDLGDEDIRQQATGNLEGE